MAATIAYAGMVSTSRDAVASAAHDADAIDVARIRAGDLDAFETLVRRHEATVYRVAFRMLGNRDDAADTVQDTFLRAYRAVSRFRGDAAFRTWLVGIAINVCRTRLTSAPARMARRSESLDEEREDAPRPALPDRRPSPEDAALGAELRAAVAAALRRLPAEHREVLVLREVEGLEYGELASVLRCRLGTVKSRLARARAALRAALEGVWL